MLPIGVDILGMSRGAITFVFDDGYREVLEHVVPVLDKHDMPGVFAVPLRFNDEPAAEVASWENWSAKLQNSGHELAAHSATHADLTRLPADKLDYELRMPAEQLGAETLVYPGGAYDARVLSAATAYYAAARTTEWGFEALPPREPLQLRTVNYSRRNWSLWKANLRVFWAWLTNAWLIETYHLVTNEPSDYEFTVPLDDFKKHLAFVTRLGISVKAIKAVCS